MKRVGLLVIVCVMLGILVGCSRQPQGEMAMPAESAASVEAGAAERAYSADFAAAPMEDVAADMAVEEAEAPAADAGGSGAMADAMDPAAAAEVSLPGQADTGSTGGRRIIRNAQMRIETDDVAAALDAATDLSVDIGGYTTQSRTWYVGDEPHASISFVVPVERFESALRAARALGDVLDENVSSQDVTGQFVDLEARIRNLENTVERVRGFLDEAENVEEALEVNNELSQLESQLEVLKGQRNVLAQQTSFSTIAIEFQPVPPAVTTQGVLEGAQGWSPLATFNDALDALLELSQAGVDFGIWLVMLGVPTLLVLLVLWWLLRAIVRLFRRPRSAKSSPSA